MTTSPTRDGLKAAACAAVDALAQRLIAVSRQIHAAPELAFAEHRAAALLTGEIEAAGLPCTRGAFGLETAFESRPGRSGGPQVALIAEYDALPGIGHACGHNLIATSALGAMLALARVLPPDLPGGVRLLGTPAEEKGGGKELMARRGAFDGLDAAMMIHPAGVNLATMPCVAFAEVEVEYHGRAAHASAMPHAGVNALDALVLAYQGIAALRQHIRSTERVHGIITDGGQAPNIVPERSAGRFNVRARDARALVHLEARVEACFHAGASATGASVEVRWDALRYLELNPCWPLAEAFQRNAESLGRTFLPLERMPPGALGSTDMGNVSHRVPSIHPMLAAAPASCTIHNAEFAHWAGSELGDAAALDGARALAMTAIDVLYETDLRHRCQATFAASRADFRLAAR